MLYPKTVLYPKTFAGPGCFTSLLAPLPSTWKWGIAFFVSHFHNIHINNMKRSRACPLTLLPACVPVAALSSFPKTSPHAASWEWSLGMAQGVLPAWTKATPESTLTARTYPWPLVSCLAHYFIIVIPPKKGRAFHVFLLNKNHVVKHDFFEYRLNRQRCNSKAEPGALWGHSEQVLPKIWNTAICILGVFRPWF